jgi:L,D-transpeptidase YcbB
MVDDLKRSFGVNRLWVDNGVGEKAQAIFSALRYAWAEGLEPADFNVATIEALWNTRTADGLDRLDRLLTESVLHYADHARFGRLYRADTADGPGPLAADSLQAAEQLVADIRESSDPFSYLLHLSPQHRHYQDLRGARFHYRQIAAQGGWPLVAQGPTIRPGDADDRVAALYERLVIEGDLDSGAPYSGIYEGAMVDAVRRFQARHGLNPDGLVGRSTLAELGVPVEDRMRTIAVNLERWRQAAHSLGRRHVLVDIAGFHLEAVEDGVTRLEMPVIVGTPYNETPVFSDAISHLELNPFWNVPVSITRNEFLPELIRDPTYLVRNHFRLFQGDPSNLVELDSTQLDWAEIGRGIARYRVRQDPGPWNSLGRIKFMMPNQFDVYLHDTPHQSLFGLTDRAFSHGCIRLARPLELAAFAMNVDPASTDFARVKARVDSGERYVLRLEQVLPVHIVYLTARVDSDGTMRFNRDLYGRDQGLQARLNP